MLKRLASVLLVVAMLTALVPALSAEKTPGDLNEYVTGNFNKAYDVYSGPGEDYYSNSEIRYKAGKCRIYGSVGEWLLVGFGKVEGPYHIGYISIEALDECDNLSGPVEELEFVNIPDAVRTEGCELTDDPVLHNERYRWMEGKTPVTILGYMGDWVYVETVLKDDLVRGWMHDYHLASKNGASAPAATVAPTKKPASTPLPTETPNIQGKESLLSSLVHNCPNTGIMLPDTFSPNQKDYLLTVASWVSRVTFTPTAYDSNAVITVNGQTVKNGQKSQVIQMTDGPQQVEIRVQGVNGDVSVYTVFLQRRPSEARTRVSVGYIDDIYEKSGVWYISADLVNVYYLSDKYYDGNRGTISNDSAYLYKYAVDEHCDYYYGTTNAAFRAKDIFEFSANYQLTPDALYTIVYIEDEIVAVMPYSPEGGWY